VVDVVAVKMEQWQQIVVAQVAVAVLIMLDQRESVALEQQDKAITVQMVLVQFVLVAVAEVVPVVTL
jgi:hypothetical protein